MKIRLILKEQGKNESVLISGEWPYSTIPEKGKPFTSDMIIYIADKDVLTEEVKNIYCKDTKIITNVYLHDPEGNPELCIELGEPDINLKNKREDLKISGGVYKCVKSDSLEYCCIGRKMTEDRFLLCLMAMVVALCALAAIAHIASSFIKYIH